MALKVAVIGAGVVGLATAAELVRAGADVRCYEKATPASAQSKGMTRIFRMAHGDPRLVELAIQARASWHTLEQRSGRRLIGDEGLIISGTEIVEEWAAGMTAAGAPNELLSTAEATRKLPIAHHSDDPVLFDPAGGATRAHRAIDILRSIVSHSLALEEVTAVEARRGSCVVHCTESTWQCDEVLITAGTDTNSLASPLGLDVPAEPFFHSRFTFETRPEYRDSSLPCWIDDSGSVGPGFRSYCQPVGRTGRYAVGVGWDGEDPDVDAETERQQSREAACAYVREALPGLQPEPVDEIQCYSNEYNFSDHGDGFLARRHDRVTAFYGANLFKFAPLLGELLAQTAIQGELQDELTLLVSR